MQSHNITLVMATWGRRLTIAVTSVPDKSYFSNPHFSTISIILGIRPQGINIHFLCLGSECSFMSNYSLHDLERRENMRNDNTGGRTHLGVEYNDGNDRESVIENEGIGHITLSVPILKENSIYKQGPSMHK